MKKAASIFAVLLMSVGLFASCESETSVEDSDALYDVQIEAHIDDKAGRETEGRP